MNLMKKIEDELVEEIEMLIIEAKGIIVALTEADVLRMLRNLGRHYMYSGRTKNKILEFS